MGKSVWTSTGKNQQCGARCEDGVTQLVLCRGILSHLVLLKSEDCRYHGIHGRGFDLLLDLYISRDCHLTSDSIAGVTQGEKCDDTYSAN